MQDILKRILEKLTGAEFWIALCFIAAGIICWEWIGTTGSKERTVLYQQIIVALTLTVGAVAAIAIHRFIRRPVFQKNVTGILVMRIVGDDTNSLQRDLMGNLNAKLRNEEVGEHIDVTWKFV